MKSLNLDKAITACLEKKVAKLNELIKTGIKKDKVEEFIDSDINWIMRVVKDKNKDKEKDKEKVAEDKGYDIFPYLNYYFIRLRR